MTEARTTKREKDGDAYFTIVWSPLTKVDRYDIALRIPSVPGLFELFYADRHHRVLFNIQKSWYGGIRNLLREQSDPELQKDPRLAAILSEHEIWHRYTAIDSFSDLQDVYYFLAGEAFGEKAECTDRYRWIYLKEVFQES